MIVGRQLYSILEKYYRNECSPEEVHLLMSHFNTESEQELLDYIMKGFELEKRDSNYDDADKETLDAVYLKLMEQIRVVAVPARQRRLWPRVAVAAAAVAAIVFGVYFFNASRHADTLPRTEFGAGSQDIAPGKNGATITLANGKVIQLSDAKSGVVVGSALKYSDGSDVRYSSGSHSSGSLKGSQSSTGPVGVHSLTPSELQGADGKAQNLVASTAKGQTYQFTLPDGTKVWLNAESKLEFPSNFVNSGTRNVKLSGEGYFEVSKNRNKPFVVATDKQEVKVLGTHFNINAYKDESSVKTTLLEGSVSVRRKADMQGVNNKSPEMNSAQAIVLKPNQQAILTDSSRVKVHNVDIEEAVAWKNEEFVFSDNENIVSIMRRVQRWYNVEVSYKGDMKDVDFTGSISRNKNISAILKLMERTGQVKFRIEGRKIIAEKGKWRNNKQESTEN